MLLAGAGRWVTTERIDAQLRHAGSVGGYRLSSEVARINRRAGRSPRLIISRAHHYRLATVAPSVAVGDVAVTLAGLDHELVQLAGDTGATGVGARLVDALVELVDVLADVADLGRPSDQVVRVGDALVEIDERRIVRDGREIQLPPKAMDVLAVLLARPREVVDVVTLSRLVWGDDRPRRMTQHVAPARDALGQDCIETVHGGYRFMPPTGH